MEKSTLQQLINQTGEALVQAGASSYYQKVFKTLTKQLLLYSHEQGTDSFSMDFGLQFLEDHYSMSSKIEQKKMVYSLFPLYKCFGRIPAFRKRNSLSCHG